MSSRLTLFSTDKLAEIIHRMNLAGTIEPLPPEAEALLNEFVAELQTRDAERAIAAT